MSHIYVQLYQFQGSHRSKRKNDLKAERVKHRTNKPEEQTKPFIKKNKQGIADLYEA